MNKRLQQFARDTLKRELQYLSYGEKKVFKLMYARNNGKRSVADAEAMELDAVVDEIPAEKLDWAMEQVSNTLFKKAKERTEVIAK